MWYHWYGKLKRIETKVELIEVGMPHGLMGSEFMEAAQVRRAVMNLLEYLTG